MIRRSLLVALALTACASGAAPVPPAKTANDAEPAEPAAKPAPPVTAEKEAPLPPPAAAPPASDDPPPEPCASSGWTCVKVSLDAKTVEPRLTKLLGDAKITETWSKWTDGRVVTYEGFSQGAIEFTLRRKPNDKNEVVAKTAKGEVVIDRRDGTVNDFTHVDLIAAEQAGVLLVDFRYMK